MVKPPSSVVIAGSGALMARLSAYYRAVGATVSEVAFDSDADPEQAAARIAGPVDLLIVADAFAAPAVGVADVTRDALVTASHRLTYLPFRVAAILKPQLAEARGRAVLVTDPTARMIATGSTSPHLDRPFRAAAHALWRCLSVEWKPDGISAGIIGLEHGWGHPADAIAQSIAGTADEAFPVELTDLEGRALGW